MFRYAIPFRIHIVARVSGIGKVDAYEFADSAQPVALDIRIGLIQLEQPGTKASESNWRAMQKVKATATRLGDTRDTVNRRVVTISFVSSAHVFNVYR